MNWKDLLKGKRMEELYQKSPLFHSFIMLLESNESTLIGNPLKEERNISILRSFILAEEETIENLRKLLVDCHARSIAPAQFYIDTTNIDLSKMKKSNLFIRFRNALRKGLSNIHAK